MADTYSQLLRIRLQQTGGNTNTWGALLNSSGLQLLEDAIAGTASITVASSDVTLSTQNGANDQARYAVLNLKGTPGAARNIIVPALSKLYVVVNGTGQTMTVKTAAGTGVEVANGTRQFLYCDGTNVHAVQAEVLGTVASATDASKLGGVDAANYARKDAFNAHSKGFATAFSALTDATTVTVDCQSSNKFRVVLAGNRTLALSNPTDGQTIELWIVQDAAGSRTLTWPSNVRFGSGVSAALSTGPNAIDVYRLTYNQATNLWVASSAGRNASSASGASTYDVTLTSGVDVCLLPLVGSPSGIVTVNVTIPAGVVIAASSPQNPALDLTGFASGSVINITNQGYVLGRGGRGGAGASMGVSGGGDGDDLWYYSYEAAANGEAGGDAIKGPGAGRALNVYNSAGYIWGGGGGGGGGGASLQRGPSVANGGGGGGGAGGGLGGVGGRCRLEFGTNPSNATNGGNASAGPNGTFGAGGSSSQAGLGSGGTGGNGGDWGSAGSSGASPTGYSSDFAGGSGGAAGKAIEPNGSVVTIFSGSLSPNIKGAVS